MKPFSIKFLSWIFAVVLLVACGGKEPIDPTPPTPPTPTVDTKAPVISVSLSSVNVIGGQEVTLGTSELKIGTKTVATWKDDVSKTCKAGLELDGKAISSGTKLSDPGKLKLTVTDEAGNSSSTEITLTKTDSQAPEIEVEIAEKNVIAGVKVKIEGNQVLFDSEVAATWKDDYSETCNVELSIAGKKINPGDILFDAGTLVISVTDEFQNKATAEITLTSVAIYGLENLQGKSLQVDQEVNLLEGLTITEGLTLTKVEVEENGTRDVITEPKTYTPEYPGTVNIILTILKPDGNTIEVRVDGIRVKGITYNSVSISNLKPGDILPIVDQVQEGNGDKDAYYHIEHLRLAEVTRVRDMLWEYGAGKHSKDEYQQLMGRLMTGMLGENPKWYDNYVIVGDWPSDEPDNHAHDEWHTLNTLVKNAVYFVVNPGQTDKYYELNQLCKRNPNRIIIVGVSIGSSVNKEQYNSWNIEGLKEYDKEKNLIIFAAWSNIDRDDETHTIVLNKIIQEEYDLPDEHSIYTSSSRAHNKNDNDLTRHLFVTFWTNGNGDVDITSKTSSNYSKFPVWFHPLVLFSWRTFPYVSWRTGKVSAEWSDKYATSHTNYVNVCMMDICFQLYAEVKDVDELLEMVRSTALTDYIRLDGMTQPLQLINPAGFYKKYLTPSTIPSSISLNETTELQKGYYKGIVFNIPGAEVLIGDEWIAFDAKNKDLILSQNPMNLTWRINGNLLKKMGYTAGQTVQGQIITIDDQWNGLRLEKDFSIQIN